MLERKNLTAIYTVFAFLWAMSLIWHYIRPRINYDVQVQDAIVIGCALLVILRPKNPYLLFVTALTSLIAYLMLIPTGSNHWLMQAIVNLALIVSFVYLMIRNKSVKVRNTDWLDVFRPIVCLLILLLYFFAVFHKLNSGYFGSKSFAILFTR